MTKEKLKKIFGYIMLGYVALVVAFYFLAGDQLKYRDSKNNIEMLTANSATEELVSGTVIEQAFINYTDRLEEINIAYTTHYRTNSGNIAVEIYHNEELISKNTFKASKLEEGNYLNITFDEPVEGLNGQRLTMFIYSDSTSKNGISILVDSETDIDYLKVNDNYMGGSICFETKASDYIFTGRYYWQIMTAIGSVLLAILAYSYSRYVNKKVSYLAIAFGAIEKYKFLISQLVSRDFKIKYKRSVLGVMWSFLNPLMTMTVQYIVFSTFFKNETTNYPVYLLIGVVCYSFFNEATSMCLTSIAHNDRLITKVYIPKYIFPLSRTISSGINLVVSLIPLLIVSLLTGLVFKKSALLALFFIACLIIFSMGVGMVLSTLMVFFRDIQFLWTVISMIWMYATPIFYPPNIIPPKYQFILTCNPLFQYIKNIRICLIDGISPEPKMYAFCFLAAIGTLIVGSFIFKKNQDKFTLYL